MYLIKDPDKIQFACKVICPVCNWQKGYSCLEKGKFGVHKERLELAEKDFKEKLDKDIERNKEALDLLSESD